MKLQEALESQFRQAIRILGEGGLVIAPTETFYGIIGDAWSEKAVKRLVHLKGRDYGKPIPLIAGSTGVVLSVATDIPPVFKNLAEEFWPGPLTVVLKAARGFPRGITAGTDSIGIRVPAQSPALDLARFYRGPLTATSANFANQPPPRSIKELDGELAESVDLVIDGGWTPGVQPSTVLNLVPDRPVILRMGVLGRQVEALLAELSWRLDDD
ncbi:MAG: L-threonylcarbamoyladenylate synthase [bacterium]|nr:L-threonylcarbamoyladenylate synthase [bacterium]